MKINFTTSNRSKEIFTINSLILRIGVVDKVEGLVVVLQLVAGLPVVCRLKIYLKIVRREWLELLLTKHYACLWFRYAVSVLSL